MPMLKNRKLSNPQIQTNDEKLIKVMMSSLIYDDLKSRAVQTDSSIERLKLALNMLKR